MSSRVELAVASGRLVVGETLGFLVQLFLWFYAYDSMLRLKKSLVGAVVVQPKPLFLQSFGLVFVVISLLQICMDLTFLLSVHVIFRIAWT